MRQLVFSLLISWIALPAVAFDPLAQDPEPDAGYPPAIAELSFDSEGNLLPGLMYLANGVGPHPTIVLLHGIPGNEKNLDIAQVLRRAGFNVMFFHYRGAWGAEGDYSVLTVDDDALAALAHLRQPGVAEQYRVDLNRLSLLGHSLGGFASLSAGSQDKGVVCVGAIAPANLGVYARDIRAQRPAAEDFLEYVDSLFMLAGFDGERMREQLLSAPMEHLDTTRFGAGLRGKTVFIVAGDRDQVTPPAQSFEPVVAAYRNDPQIRLRSQLLSGDHSFSWSRIALSQRLLEWYSADCR